MKTKLTDARLKNMTPAPFGKRVTVWDTEVGNFGVRVTDRVDPVTNEPRRTFIVMRRLNGQLIRHKIGVYPAVTLQAARAAAREVNLDFERGIDPKARKQVEVEAEAARLQNTFESVAEEFIKRHVMTLRSGTETAASIRRVFISRWGKKPISDITAVDIVKMVDEFQDSGRDATARKMLAHVSKLFSWANSRKTYGLIRSPCSDITPKEILAVRTKRSRVLNDRELVAVWTAIETLHYPAGPFVKMLLLTGQRLREVADATWGEIDLKAGLWTIPAARMKGASSHEVPLSRAAIELLKAIPRFEPKKKSASQQDRDKQFVFTTTEGLRPISGFSKFKTRIDDKLKDITPWCFHDLRRTVRTNLSGLAIPHNVCELVIAHRQPELDQIYDQHRYREEKRYALELWSKRLHRVVEPRTDNVISIAGGDR